MKVIDIPILLYETFVIEEKFGLSKKNLSSFFSDACVESLITLFVSPVILYGYLQLIEHAPDNFFYLVTFQFICYFLFETTFSIRAGSISNRSDIAYLDIILELHLAIVQ